MVGRLIGVSAFAAGVAAGGCSLTTLEYEQCRTDADCAVSLGETFLCSQDGLCRELPEQPGECVGQIHVRMLAALTGPLAEVGVPYYKGEVDLIREINDTGGLRGCEIVIKAVDYSYDLTKARQAYDGWRAEASWDQVITLFGFGTDDTVDLSPELAEQEIVVISASYSGDVASPVPVELGIDVPAVNGSFEPIEESVPKVSPGYPYNFFAGTDYSTGGRVAMEFANKQGAKKVAFFACSVGYCQSPLAAIKTYAAEDLRLAIGRDLVVELGDDATVIEDKVMGFFEEELAQQALDPEYEVPDWIWIGNTTASAARIGSVLGRVRDELGLDVYAISNNWGFDENISALCEGGCVDYFYGIMPFAAYGDNVPGMKQLTAIHDKWRDIDAEGFEGNEPERDADGDPLSYRNVRYVQGYASVLLWQRAMERLVDYEKAIDGKSLRAVLETFDNVNTGGLTPPLSFKPDDHRPQSTEKIYRIGDEGELVNVPPDAAVFLQDEWLGW